MKKFTMCLVGAMMVLSLAACTPTPQKQAESAQSMEEASTGGAADKVPDPTTPELNLVSIYSVNKEGTGLERDMDGVEELTPQAIADKLVEYGVLESGTKVLAFDLEGEKEPEIGPGQKDAGDAKVYESATLNLSQLPSTVNDAILTAIGNTFTENFNADKVTLQVNGEAYAGGPNKDGVLSYNPSFEKLGN